MPDSGLLWGPRLVDIPFISRVAPTKCPGCSMPQPRSRVGEMWTEGKQGKKGGKQAGRFSHFKFCTGTCGEHESPRGLLLTYPVSCQRGPSGSMISPDRLVLASQLPALSPCYFDGSQCGFSNDQPSG